MIITAEISMYPLQEDYRTLIKDFIGKLNTYTELRVVTTATATMVVGEYSAVMNMFTQMLAWSWETHGRAVFVTKFIPDYNPD